MIHSSWRFAVLPALWVIFIFVASLLPASETPGFLKINIPHLDKIFHFAAYLILAILCILGVPPGKISRTNKGGYLLILLSAAMGGSIELLQALTPTRSADLLDWLADLTGVWLALYLYISINRFRNWMLSRIKCLSFVFPA